MQYDEQLHWTWPNIIKKIRGTREIINKYEKNTCRQLQAGKKLPKGGQKIPAIFDTPRGG